MLLEANQNRQCLNRISLSWPASDNPLQAEEESMNIAVLVKGLSTLSWAAVIALIVVAISQSTRGKSFKSASGWLIGLIVISIVLTSVSAGLVFIQPQERGVVISAERRRFNPACAG
jgi:hypothetical protein